MCWPDGGWSQHWCWFCGGWARSAAVATVSWGQASALVPIRCLERVQLGSEANMLEGGFQSGAFQHQCPHNRTSFTRMTATSVCIPRMSSICLLPLQEVLKDWQVGLIQVHFKLLMHSWIPKQVRFACAVYFFQHPGTPRVCPTGLQSQTFWGLVFPMQDPQAGSLMWGSDLSLQWENLCNIIIVQCMDSPPRNMDLNYITSLPFPPIML